MKIHMTFEKETANTVRFAEDETGQPDSHPGAPPLRTLYVQKFAWANLGKPQHLHVTLEAADTIL